MSSNMNTAPVSPNENVGEASGSAGGWSQLESGLIVPSRLAQEVGGMTREKRIADGQERVDALKSRARDGLGKIMQGLKDHFYISVSRGAELSGQLAEKGAEAKEAAGNAWAAAKAKTSELFNKGRDFIAQQAENARGRKAARLAKRQERIAELDSRQAERTDREQARQYMKELRAGQDIAAEAADRQAGKLVERAQEVVAEAGRKLNETNKQLAEAAREEHEARAEAEGAARAAEEAMARADQNPEDEELRLIAEEKAGLSTAANAKLKRVSLRVQNLEAAASRLAAKAERTAKTAESAQERIESRRQQAETRKAERAAARREARGDKWESAKDRIMRIANNDPNWLKRFGAKAAIASGKLARKVVDGLVSAGRGFAEGWREAAAQKAPQAVPVKVQN